MRRLLSVFFLLTTLFIYSSMAIAYEKELNGLAASMGERISIKGKKTVAVVDFTDLQGNVTELGRFIAEELSVDLSGLDKGVEVVDRTHLKSLLREHKLSTSGLIDSRTAAKLGQIVGVDALVTGTITPFGDSVRVSAKILDTAKAKVISAASCDIAKTKAIEDLINKEIASTQQSVSSGADTTVAPYAGNAQSQKVGKYITMTLKKITVAKGLVLVSFNVSNNADKMLRIARNNEKRPAIELIDDLGNIFHYDDGLNSEWSDRMKSSPHPFNLAPKAYHSLIFKFNARRSFDNREIKDMGTNFTLTASLHVYDSVDDSVSTHEISFVDIKRQKQR